MEFMPPELMNIHIRIDNIPQGKDWKQVRTFLSKFIPRDHILNIKVLPAMATMTPPFIPITSCVCVLHASVDWNSLLMQLNGVQWEYYTLGAILLPPPALAPAMGPALGAPHLSGANAGVAGVPSGSGRTLQPRQPHQHAVRQHRVGSGGVAGMYLGPGPTPGAAQGPGPGPGPGPGGLPGPDNGTSSSRQQQHHQHQHQHQHQRPQSTSGPSGMPHQPRKLKQLFNETSFRKQMSSRSMYQIKFKNFPPCLHWDEIVKFKTMGIAGQHVTRAGTAPDLIVKTLEPQTYGKLKWTMLKDFIKSHCPELFENTSSFEFYVGVYESGELDVEIQLCEPQDETEIEIETETKNGDSSQAGSNDTPDSETTGSNGDSSSNQPHVPETNNDTPKETDAKDTDSKSDGVKENSTQDTVQDTDSKTEVNDKDLKDGKNEVEGCSDALDENSNKTLDKNSSSSSSSSPEAEDSKVEKYMVKATQYEAVVGFVNYDKFLKCLDTFQGKDFGLNHKLVLEVLESVEPS
ncbi:hypothetical protein C6P43_002477 [Kluyveromyces marxianus]|nr:hypothetical protein C6P43_002477 [Kluyveromyces marxianus]